jgi:hypothetical protein
MASRTSGKPTGKPGGKAGAKGKKKGRKGCAILGCLVFVVLLAGVAFALDQYGVFPLPLLHERIPRVLPGAKADEEEAAAEEEAVGEESAAPDAEAEAQRRLDQQEGKGAESAPTESGPGQAVESGPAGRREVVVTPKTAEQGAESQPAGLNVTLPPGGLRSLDPKSPQAKELKRRIESVGAILQAMKAKSAAETLQKMPLEIQVEIFRTMEEGTAAKILDEMPADQRGKIAIALIQ